MTYSRPGTGQVDAFGDVANPMAITKQGGRSRTEVSRNGAYLDNRNPAQVGKNARAKTAAVESFLDFLVQDIAPVANDELKAKGNAAAMEAITSIPGMADGSFYRQSDVEQRKVLKDYTLSGYALDQVKSYGAGVAVGQYKEDVTDRMISSSVLASAAPQAERDAEKQRIFTESRALLQGVEPGYLAKYAPQLSQLEGQVIGKTEALARDARNANLENAAVSNFSQSWDSFGTTFIQVADSDDRAIALVDGPLAQIKASWPKAQPNQTPAEFYSSQEKGMLGAVLQAIGNEEGEKAMAIMESWEELSKIKFMITPTVNFWDLGNKAGVDGKTTIEKITTLKVRANRLLDQTIGDKLIADNGELLAGALNGDKFATDAILNLAAAAYASGDPKQVEEMNAFLQQANLSQQYGQSLTTVDPEVLGQIQTWADDPNVSTEEFVNRVQEAERNGSISKQLMIQEIQRRASPTQLQVNENRTFKELAETTVGFANKGVFVPGEDTDVNAALDAARESLTKDGNTGLGEKLEEYLVSSFLSDAKANVRTESEGQGKPMPEGAELQAAIKKQAILLIKKRTVGIVLEDKKKRRITDDRVKAVEQPVMEAIKNGVPIDKIWGDSIIETAKKTGARPENVWAARYEEALLEQVKPNGENLYTPKLAEKKAKEQLNIIRRKFREQKYGAPGSKGIPTNVPVSIEISYDTAVPGMQEEIAAASKNPDQEGEGSVLAVGGTKILNALGRVLPGGGSPAAAGELASKSARSESIQAIQNSNGWKSLNRMFAKRERVSSTSPPLPQLPPTALTDTVAVAITADRHPFFVHIGIAEGTRTINGGYTRHYYGHRDIGDDNWNRGTVSGGRNSNATPKQVDAQWMRTLTARGARLAPILAQAGLRPGTVGYNRLMFNYLDLSVQAPKAADDFAGKLSLMKAGNWSIEVMAKARADSFFNPITGRLEAGGFDNNYSRLLGDQRSRAGVWDYKRRI